MKTRGFTLIELLVALVILSLLSVAAYRGLDSVLETRKHLAAETRKWQQLSLFFARIEQDVAQASPRPNRNEGGLIQAEWLGKKVVLGENEGALEFTRVGIPDQGHNQKSPMRIAYRLEQGKIIMLRWPYLDQAPHAEPKRYPILENVKTFEVRHMDSMGAWLENWPPPGQMGGLPNAVEIKLTLKDNNTITRVFALQ